MEAENILRSPNATYQLFVKRTLLKQNNKHFAFPVFGNKICLQHSPRLSYPTNGLLQSKRGSI